MSRPSNSFMTSATRRSQDPASETSAWRATPREPSFRTAPTVASAASFPWLYCTPTSAPSRASSRTAARPMPPLPPVTRGTRPSSRPTMTRPARRVINPRAKHPGGPETGEDAEPNTAQGLGGLRHGPRRPHLHGVRVPPLRGLHHARRMGAQPARDDRRRSELGPRGERCLPVALPHVPGTRILHRRGDRSELPRVHDEPGPRQTIRGRIPAHPGRRPPPLGGEPASRGRPAGRVLCDRVPDSNRRGDRVHRPPATTRSDLAAVHGLPHRI